MVVVAQGQIGVPERRVGSAPVVVAFCRPGRQGDADIKGAQCGVEASPAVGTNSP